MAIEMTGIDARHERRIRIVFSNTLAAGAFTTPSLYVVESLDGKGLEPGVLQALVVPGSSTNVEIALDTDLVPGALYRITASGVPATDLSTSTSASRQEFRFGSMPAPRGDEPKTSDADLVLYGRDAVWAGDYVETPEGDLATVSGVANVQGAQQRRMLGQPLPWAPGYSARAYEAVDLPSTAVNSLYGRLQAQAIVDDRVSAARVVLVEDGESTRFDVTSILIGGQIPSATPVEIKV